MLEKNKEDERIQEEKLKEKVYRFLKCDKCDNDIDNYNKIYPENINSDKIQEINQNNNIKLNYPIIAICIIIKDNIKY